MSDFEVCRRAPPAGEAPHARAKRVSTVSEALKTMANGQLALVAGSLAYATVGAVLDSRPGSEFVAAVEAAREVGAAGRALR